MLKVVCVLRSGGDYDIDYVHRLAADVFRNLKMDFKFICLTDVYKGNNGLVDFQPLQHDWPGWWSLMEIYSIPGPVLFFGLDTAIVGDITPLAKAIESNPMSLVATRGWKKGNFSSQILGWGEWSEMEQILSRFKVQAFHGTFRDRNDHWEFRVGRQTYRGDQDWLEENAPGYVNKCSPSQVLMDGIYSYKHHCRERLPDDARIVCFHGKPRPHELDPRPKWLWPQEVVTRS